MEMTNSEIVRSYKEARAKKAQIKILAELNAVTTGEIEEILREGGILLDTKTRKRTPAPKTDWTPELIGDLKQFAGEGLTYNEIAERLGVDSKAVYYKANALGLKVTPSSRWDKKNSKASEEKVQEDETTEQAESRFAESLYIEQLESLLKERTEEVCKLRSESAELSVKCKALQSEARTNFGLLEEIFFLADCIGAVDFETLVNFNSVVYLVNQILTLAQNELEKEKCPTSVGADAGQK